MTLCDLFYLHNNTYEITKLQTEAEENNIKTACDMWPGSSFLFNGRVPTIVEEYKA